MSLHITQAPSLTRNLSAVPRTMPFQHPSHVRFPRRLPCVASQASLRRSANYQPNLWSDDYIQSITSNYYTVEDEEDKIRRINILKEDIRKLIYEKKKLEDQLELIDQLQQLGVAYHFKDDIKNTLGIIYGSLEDKSMLLKDNCHATALLFRLLRNNDFTVSEDMLGRFKDEKGHFKACLEHEVKDMLSLYEASYLAREGELVLNEAMDFTTESLKCLMEEGSIEPRLREHVAHALELPLNRRMPRLHSRWFIETCHTMNPVLLELAKLDFNAVQSIYKRELRELSRWWTDLGLAQRLPFFRDRLTENYLWTVGWPLNHNFGVTGRFKQRQAAF